MLLTSTLFNALSAQLAACANYFLISNWAGHGAHSGTALHFSAHFAQPASMVQLPLQIQ